ncbi:MAG TPA: hypothetical protein VFI17_03405 [Solirubrobacterales bacterium]|nr:hypothetical protein [Solirubrobacterales bacterium]
MFASVEFQQQRWVQIVFLAGAFLISSAFSAPSAPATLVGEVTGGVGATVEAVEAAPTTAPSLPSAIPAAAPPAPTATPTTPQAPVKLQTEAAPTTSPSPPSSSSNPPSVNEMAGTTEDSVDPATSIDKEVTQEVSAPDRDEGRRFSTRLDRPDVGANDGATRATTTAASAPRSLTTAAIARLLVLAPSVLRGASGSPVVGHAEAKTAPRLTVPGAPTVAEVERISYLVVLAALLALLALTVWREFRPAHRARVRW